jgi:Mrp family chromosome partitioning ATPase
MVASAAPGDGKTTVARHLAGAAARMGSRVLLLEADLRRPTIALQLDVSGAEHVGKEDVYAAYEMAASNPQDVGVTVLASVQRAFLENDRALQGKRRLTAATFGLLLLSALLIGLLNLGNQATLGLS